MKITVASKRDGASGWYVGRPSALGNPFTMRTEADRDRVIGQYREWLAHKIADRDAAVMNELNAMLKHEEITLVCWCAPKRCHADVIAQWLHTMSETK